MLPSYHSSFLYRNQGGNLVSTITKVKKLPRNNNKNMNKFELISEIELVITNISKLRYVAINVYSPDGKVGIISLWRSKGQAGSQKISLDFATPDQFPWRLSAKGKEMMQKVGYNCGKDLVTSFCAKGEEGSLLNVLFDTLSSYEDMFEKITLK